MWENAEHAASRHDHSPLVPLAWLGLLVAFPLAFFVRFMLLLGLHGTRFSLDSFFDALTERFIVGILIAVLIIIVIVVVVVVLARAIGKHAGGSIPWRLPAFDSLSDSRTDPCMDVFSAAALSSRALAERRSMAESIGKPNARGVVGR